MSIQKQFLVFLLLAISLAPTRHCCAMAPGMPLVPAAADVAPDILPLLLQISPGEPVNLNDPEPITHDTLVERITSAWAHGAPYHVLRIRSEADFDPHAFDLFQTLNWLRRPCADRERPDAARLNPFTRNPVREAQIYRVLRPTEAPAEAQEFTNDQLRTARVEFDEGATRELQAFLDSPAHVLDIEIIPVGGGVEDFRLAATLQAQEIWAAMVRLHIHPDAVRHAPVADIPADGHVTDVEQIAHYYDRETGTLDLSSKHITAIDGTVFEQIIAQSAPGGRFTSLQTLNLSANPITALPDNIGELTNLQTLDLCGCRRLPSLPSEIGRLTNLQKLNLYGCTHLTALPVGISELSQLRELNLSYCDNITTLPSGFGRLTNLQDLNLSYCSSLTALPDGIGELSNLQLLDLAFCSNLTTLPHGIGSLSHLQQLSLCGTNLTVLPEEIGRLSNLQIFILSECSNLTTLPNEIGGLIHLQELDLRSCSRLTSLPKGIGKLSHLHALNLAECGRLTNLPKKIGRLANLQEVLLVGTPFATSSRALTLLRKLLPHTRIST